MPLLQVMGVLDAMPSSNLKPENEDAVRFSPCICSYISFPSCDFEIFYFNFVHFFVLLALTFTYLLMECVFGMSHDRGTNMVSFV